MVNCEAFGKLKDIFSNEWLKNFCLLVRLRLYGKSSRFVGFINLKDKKELQSFGILEVSEIWLIQKY